MRQFYLAILFCIAPSAFFWPVVHAQDLQAIPALTGPVVDTSGTLSASEIQQLSDKLLMFHKKYGAQMQVLIVTTSAPEDAFSYSMRVVEKWKLGSEKKDDGLLLFIAKNDRRAQIQVGYGLEGTIPDAIASRLLNEVMAPYFKQADFYGGINAVVDGVYARVSGDASLAPATSTPKQFGQIDNAIIVLIFIAFVVLKILKALVGTFVSAGVVGPLAFFAAWLLFGVPVVMAFLGVCVLLAFALSPPARGLGRGYRSGYGGGIGGGGWSGGGGGFGGGGAGGRW